jgi:hypothetical protein
MPLIEPQIYVPGPGDGQPPTPEGAFTLPGSGLAVPGGLECVFEYNNLYLNVQQNVDRYKVKNIDGLYDADIRDTRDVNTNSDGETPYNSFYGGRTIVLSGTIETFSIPKLRDMEQALRSAFADLTTEYPLYFRTGNFATDHMIYCKKITATSGSETQQNNMIQRDFQVSLRASNPRFLAVNGKFVDVTALPGQVAQANPFLLATCINAGNYKAQPVFRMYGPSTGLTITNDTTGQSFTINSIGYGDYLEFNMGTPPQNVKYLTNSTGQNMWNMLADNSQYIDFMGTGPANGALYDGTNNIFFYGNCSRVQISWADSWI